jgi:hypothetical protein
MCEILNELGQLDKYFELLKSSKRRNFDAWSIKLEWNSVVSDAFGLLKCNTLYDIVTLSESKAKDIVELGRKLKEVAENNKH